jgi:pilus assembly protein CpaB
MNDMKAARIAVLGVALAAGGIAAYLASTGEQKPVVAEAPPVQKNEVLVAAGDIPVGTAVAAKDMRWQAWPHDSMSAGMITREAMPGAMSDLAGAIARNAFVAGEPIRHDKLIKGDAGFMSAILPSGMRALAIAIDNRGTNSAGGFILPNDRVDVIRTFRDEVATKMQGTEVVVSETILRNVRVLAIGQNVQEKDGQKVVIGETATLELDPRQVEVIALAQRIGQLSLSLRSMADASKPDEPIQGDSGQITIVRHGIPSQR